MGGLALLIAKAKIFGGLYLGWGIGANDSANVFGTAVATNSVSFKTAVTLVAIFGLLGAVIEGPKLFQELNFGQAKEARESGNLSDDEKRAGENLALAATLSAAVTTTVLTYMSLPISVSQAAVGAFMGIAIASSGFGAVAWGKFLTMLACWILNPIGSMIVCLVMLYALSFLINRLVKSVLVRDRIFKIGLLLFGAYGAYALGANNVAVTTAPYYHAGMFGPLGLKSARIAAAVGGLSIAIGAITYSYKVMATVGKGITPLDPFSALVSVLAHSVALHFFTQLKIPVSSSQAIVGAVIGVGIYHGAATVNRKTLVKIFCGWIATPLVSGGVAFLIALGLRALVK